jgi:hypothetical protein
MVLFLSRIARIRAALAPMSLRPTRETLRTSMRLAGAFRAHAHDDVVLEAEPGGGIRRLDAPAGASAATTSQPMRARSPARARTLSAGASFETTGNWLSG